jgi:hypothetical protein
MSLRSLSAVAVLAASAWCAAPAGWAQEATVQQVYQAAEAGKLVEAQALMDKVLQAHPNSGKAHFVEAELLARQGKFAEAATELATAERLAPGLPFAKPDAVQKLKTLVARAQPASAASGAATPAAPQVLPAAPVQPASNVPWTMIVVIGGLVVLAVVFFRNRAGRRAVQGGYPHAAGAPGGGPGYPQSAANPQYGPGGPGMGSGIMGGLATGAAVGAGAVAGGALMHHLLDGDRSGTGALGNHLAPGADPLATPDPLLAPEPPANYDMGGDDFGVSDPGRWDDGGGGGGDGGGDEWT